MKETFYLDIHLAAKYVDNLEFENWKLEEGYRRLGFSFAVKYASKESIYVYTNGREEFLYDKPLSELEIYNRNLIFIAKRIRLKLEA